MAPTVPPTLLPYLESAITTNHGLILITSTLSTPSPWLVLRFIHAALFGLDGNSRANSTCASQATSGRQGGRQIVLVSLFRSLNLWTEMGRKMGLDFQSLLGSNKIKYVDGLVCEGLHDSSTVPPTRLASCTLKNLGDALNTLLQIDRSSTIAPSSGAPAARMPISSTTQGQESDATQPLILIDGIDFLLASQVDASSVNLQSFLASLRTQAQNLILTCSADEPLLEVATSVGSDSSTALERDHAHFLTSMAHQCSWVFQLRGLDTGSAKDVSGVIRASRGAAFDADEADTAIDDGEWLYQLKGDGSVRVWSRGE